MPPNAGFGRRVSAVSYTPRGAALGRVEAPAASVAVERRAAGIRSDTPAKIRALPVVSWMLIAVLFLIFWAEIHYTPDFAPGLSLTPARFDRHGCGGRQAGAFIR